MNDSNLNALGIKPLRKPGCSGPIRPEEMAWIMRQAERTLPIEVRVEARLREMYQEVENFNPSNRRVTPTEWVMFRRCMRRGLRIAKKFRKEWYTEFFQMLFNSMNIHCSLSGYLKPGV